MRPRRLIAPVAALSLLAAITLASCGKDSSGPTNPGPTLELNSGAIGPGQQYAHTFANPGSFSYKCTIHTVMTGTVTVATGQPATAAVTIQNSTATGFSPQSVSVAPGGTVTWTNAPGGVTHTVTSN